MPPGIVTPSVPEFLVLLFEQTAKDIVQETENMAPATQASVSPRDALSVKPSHTGTHIIMRQDGLAVIALYRHRRSTNLAHTHSMPPATSMKHNALRNSICHIEQFHAEGTALKM